MRISIFLNEQHSLLEQQRELLDARFGQDSWEIFPVPSTGWTANQQEDVFQRLLDDSEDITVVFASPVPLLQKLCAESAGYRQAAEEFYASVKGIRAVYVFHNDKREKKELPNGKVIFTVAKTGWELK